MTRALVVDDDAESGQLAQRILGHLAIDEIVLLSSGAPYDALVRDSGHFDLLLLDIRLAEGESGFDLAERVLDEEGPAVVMVSAIDDAGVFRKAVTLGAHGYVVKPYRASELQISAMNALHRRELEQQAAAHRRELVAVVHERTAELRHTLAELERSQRARDEMLHNCSHELKTPLTPILGWASYLGRRADTSPDQVRSCAAVIEEQGHRLLAVVEALLAASAVSAGMVGTAVPGLTCDAGAVARSVGVGRDDITVYASADPVGVPLGEQGLRAVLSQLLHNAERFAPGSPVAVRVVRDGHEVVITVEDHGPGLPEGRAAPELLQSFVQGDGSATRTVGGLGIGLYVVAGLVQAHDGEVLLEETPGGGLTVVIRLPYAGCHSLTTGE